VRRDGDSMSWEVVGMDKAGLPKWVQIVNEFLKKLREQSNEERTKRR
jgi:hypothetical protein